MSVVFLSQKINTTKRNLIASILKSVDPELKVVDDNSGNVLFRVVSLMEYNFIPLDKTLTISDLVVMSMDKYQFNPFVHKKSKKIKNLFLYGKTIAFDTFIDSIKKTSLSRNIIQMGGSIVDYNLHANFYLGDPKLSMNRTKKLINYKWITILIESTKYVDPAHFLLEYSISSATSPLPSQNASLQIIPSSPSMSRDGTLMLSALSSQSAPYNYSQTAKELSQNSLNEFPSTTQSIDFLQKEPHKLHTNATHSSYKSSIKPNALITINLSNDNQEKVTNIQSTQQENIEPSHPKAVRLSNDIFKNLRHLPQKNEVESINSDPITQFSQIVESDGDFDDVTIEPNDSYYKIEEIKPSQDPLMRLLYDE